MTEKSRIPLRKKGRSSKKFDRDGTGRFKRPGLLTRMFLGDRLKWIILILLSPVIAILLFPNFLNKPKVYRIGDVAERDIKATRDFLLENRAQTEKKREEAVKGVLSVYDFDSTSLQAASRIREAFRMGRAFAVNKPETAPKGAVSSAQDVKGAAEETRDISAAGNRFFETLEIQPHPEMFEQLLRLGFPSSVENAVLQQVTQVFERGVVGNRQMLREQMERGSIILHDINSKEEVEVSQFDRFFDPMGARVYIRSQQKVLEKKLQSDQLADIAIALSEALIKPNLTYNQRETESRKDLARRSVKPTYFRIKRGEMLIREGERIGPQHILKLTEETRSQTPAEMIGRVPAMAILTGALFFVIYMVGVRGIRAFRLERRDLLFSSLALLGMFLFIWAYNFVAEEVARGFPPLTHGALLFSMPVAFGAMLISVFQGIGVAVAFSLVLSVLAAFIIGDRVDYFVYFLINSLVAAYGVRNCSDRGILIKTGIIVGLINIILSLSIVMIYSPRFTVDAVFGPIAGFLGGILAGVMATGILPLIEMSFGFTTNIKLLELANLDQPLLRDLMVQAPGTYHHSVITSNMVEATAKAVDANPLLAKVSAYYHDIGKMNKPLYFIENQRTGENRHEKLAPSMSSLILISHVKDGVELAKKHRLGREIIDIIQQHHGKSLISYFYQKAKDRKFSKGRKPVEVKEEDFRYPGPKPQTKEAGLVMLADMVEAATRSLVDPTPARIQGMVQRIINKVFSDGQLDECELTLKDLHEIAKSFNKTLSGIFHHRVEYPGMISRPTKKARNGNTDQVAGESLGTRKAEDQEETEEGLRRLGLS